MQIKSNEALFSEIKAQKAKAVAAIIALYDSAAGLVQNDMEISSDELLAHVGDINTKKNMLSTVIPNDINNIMRKIRAHIDNK